MISFIAAYALWLNDAGWQWWLGWLPIAMFNLLHAITGNR